MTVVALLAVVAAAVWVAARGDDRIVAEVPGATVSVRPPNGEGPHPVLVHVPGGGWTALDDSPVREDFGHEALQDDGWAVVTVEYVPADGETTSALDQASAVSAALAWVHDVGPAHDLGGPVVAMGHSAGAHLLAVGTRRTDPAKRPDALVLVAGVYDFAADVRASPMLADGLRRAIGCDAGRCDGTAALEPARGAGPADPPAYVVHGTADSVVPAASSVRYVDALHDAGAAARLQLVDGAGHRDDALDAAVRDALDDAVAQVRAARSSR